MFEELARRAGIAIENARLYRETQNAVRLRDEFLSIASHELKTPLTSMQLQVDGVQRSVTRPESLKIEKLAHRVEVIDQQLQRLTLLINGLLDVSRATAGRLQLEIGDVDLAAVVSDAVARMKDDLEAANCTLSVDVPPGIVGRWDRLRLDQVVTNFVTNAIKYASGQPIDIRGSRTDHGSAILTVRDRGIGISKEDHTRIFERFGRAVPADQYGGLGLGLWIVKEFVGAMGGTVSVDSRPGEGSAFTVELPLAGPDEHPSVH
jgi:signal transduction histidine kinase